MDGHLKYKNYVELCDGYFSQQNKNIYQRNVCEFSKVISQSQIPGSKIQCLSDLCRSFKSKIDTSNMDGHLKYKNYVELCDGYFSQQNKNIYQRNVCEFSKVISQSQIPGSKIQCLSDLCRSFKSKIDTSNMDGHLKYKNYVELCDGYFSQQNKNIYQRNVCEFSKVISQSQIPGSKIQCLSDLCRSFKSKIDTSNMDGHLKYKNYVELFKSLEAESNACLICVALSNLRLTLQTWMAI
eukprot:403349570